MLRSGSAVLFAGHCGSPARQQRRGMNAGGRASSCAAVDGIEREADDVRGVTMNWRLFTGMWRRTSSCVCTLGCNG